MGNSSNERTYVGGSLSYDVFCELEKGQCLELSQVGEVIHGVLPSKSNGYDYVNCHFKRLHVKNSLITSLLKSVEIARYCLMTTDVGEAFCKLFDSEEDAKGKLKGSPIHFDGEDSRPPEPSSHMRWAGSTMLHPSLLYQHVQHEENIHHAMLGRLPSLSFHRNSYSYLDSDNSLCMNRPVLHQSLSNRPGRRNEFLLSTKNDTTREEHLPLSLSEDDFLSMTYEEYLQAIGSSFSSRCLVGPLIIFFKTW